MRNRRLDTNNGKESYPWLQDLQQLKRSIASRTCPELVGFLRDNWGKQPVSYLYFYVSGLVEKQCEPDQVIVFLENLLRSEDDFYRYMALEFIRKSGGRKYKWIFIEVARHDRDDGVVQGALMNLTELFRDERDTEVLSLAYSIYADHNTSTQLKLAAAATMMYQLSIPHDAAGRPAWWDEDEETINHPALQRAIAETREILNI